VAQVTARADSDIRHVSARVILAPFQRFAKSFQLANWKSKNSQLDFKFLEGPVLKLNLLSTMPTCRRFCWHWWSRRDTISRIIHFQITEVIRYGTNSPDWPPH